jgi:TolA-binding protein
MIHKFIIFFIIFGGIFMSHGQEYGESDDFSYALKLFNEGFYDIAVQQFNLFVNRYPRSERVPDAKYYQAMSLYNINDYENARIEFQSMAVSYPEHQLAPGAWEKLGYCYLNLVKLEDAAKAFETVKVLYPNDPSAPNALYQAGLSYFKLKNLTKSELVLKDFLDRYPDSPIFPRARLLMARLLVKKGEYDQGRKEFEKVLESKTTDEIYSETHLFLAEYFQNIGQIQRAKDEYNIILSNYPQTSQLFFAVHNAALLSARTQDLMNAYQILNKYMERFKVPFQRNQIKITLAAVEYLQGEYPAAERTLESISTTGMNDSLIIKKMFYLGNVYLKQKRLEKAQEQFEKLLKNNQLKEELEEYFSETEVLLGYIYLQRNQFNKGYDFLLMNMNNYPQKPNRDLRILDLFDAAIKNNNFAEAEDLYRRLEKNFPQHAQQDDLLFNLAKAYFRIKDFTSAQNKFKEFSRNYYCSVKYDSACQYLQIIEDFYNIDQSIGVQKLAQLIGRVLSQDDLPKLKLDLAQIYLNQLKDLPEAIQLAESLIQDSEDPELKGKAYLVVGECYRRQAKLKEFWGEDIDSDFTKAQQALQHAMEYINSISNQDSLSYLFLELTTSDKSNKNISSEKKIEFWQHFITSYPTSTLFDKARMHLVDTFLEDQKMDLAQQELEKLFQTKNENVAGEAYFKSGKIYLDLGEFEKASVVLKEFLLQHENHPRRAQAFALLAEIHQKLGKLAESAQFWMRLKNEYNYSEWGEEAVSKIPDILLATGNNQDVLDFTSDFLYYQFSDDLILNSLYIPQFPVFYFFTGKAYFQIQMYDNSRKALLSYLFLNLDARFKDEVYFLLGEMDQIEGDNQSALLHFQVISKNEGSPFYIQANEKIADIYYNSEQFSNAQSLYTQLVSQAKDSDLQKKYRIQEMLCLIKQGQLKAFENNLSIFQKTYSKDKMLDNHLANFEFEIGKYYFLKKNYDPAVDKFERVIKKYKNTEYADDSEYYLGLTYSTLNRIEKAQEILSQFSQKYPGSPLLSNIYITLGSLYYRGEKADLALNTFKRAVELAENPETKKIALSNLIKVYQDLGLWDGMLTQSRLYIESYPEAEDVINKKILVGSALIRLNRFNDAVDYLKNAKLEASIDQEPEIQFYIGEAYFNAGQYESAIREFVKIPLLSKQTKLQWEASALYYSGQAYEKMGRVDDAIRMYQEIVNRPGIIIDLKREAQKKIDQLRSTG